MKVASVVALAASLAGFAGCRQESARAHRSASSGQPERLDTVFRLEPDESRLLIDRSFDAGGRRRVAIDIERMELSWDFDVAAAEARGRALLVFHSTGDGYPYFLMRPSADSVALDGVPAGLDAVADPDGLTAFVSLDRELVAGQRATLEISYRMPASRVSFRPDGVGFVTSMADIVTGNYFEAYAPANFEADLFALTIDLRLSGATSAHRLFTNGAVAALGDDHWSIEFPPYFDSSAIFLHLTNSPLEVRASSYAGADHVIPLTVYSADGAKADQALAMLPGLFSELESAFGPYAHPAFTAYISGGGGMEHSGATITSVSALGHELMHSWFARGVMPADGRSGWIDEAIASWRDVGYPRAAPSGRAPTNLAYYSLFRLFAPANVYVDGRELLSEIDYALAEGGAGGLRPLLASFYAEYRHRAVTPEIFRSYLERAGGIDLGEAFARHVYGARVEVPVAGLGGSVSLHPPALTAEEIEGLR